MDSWVTLDGMKVPARNGSSWLITKFANLIVFKLDSKNDKTKSNLVSSFYPVWSQKILDL